MRVLAARFPDKRGASAALDALRARLHLPAGDAAIAPLGTPGEGETGDLTLLAGRFRDDQTASVRALVKQSGGEVVADVDEEWTQPRPVVGEPPSQSSFRGVASRSSMNPARSRERERQAIVQ